MKRWMLSCITALSCMVLHAGNDWECNALNDGFSITSPGLRMTVRNGVITGFEDLKNNVRYTRDMTSSKAILHGIGMVQSSEKQKMQDGLEDARETYRKKPPEQDDALLLHPISFYHTLFLGLPLKKWKCQRYPYQKSVFRLTRKEGWIEAEWKGLTDGVRNYPEDIFTIHAQVDSRGFIVIRTSGQSQTRGVFGTLLSLTNLRPDLEFFIPVAGGMKFNAKDTRTTRYFRDYGINLEAPAFAVEAGGSTLGIWAEDETFRPRGAFLSWTGKEFEMTVEHLNLKPFDPHTRTESIKWYFGSFKGNWVNALVPYRNWYHKTFKNEIARRDGVKWANRIHALSGVYDGMHIPKVKPAMLRQMAYLLEPDTLLFYESFARAAGFDMYLPDWTPRCGYPEWVKGVKSYGYRTLAYVNPTCVSFASPVFVKDNIKSFGLTKKYVGFFKQKKDFSNAKEGDLLFLDVLSPRWRKYHTDMDIRWKKETGTDANYEDTAGTSGDFGNGTINGISGAQGTVALMREMLERNSGVPMASEFGIDSIAFAVKWPLKDHIAWSFGNIRFMEFLIRHSYPVSAYLFGPGQRPYVGLQSATASDKRRYLAISSADAMGGLAEVMGYKEALSADNGLYYHLNRRVALFSRKQLQPYFSSRNNRDNIVSEYKDRDGKIYTFTRTEDGKVQSMRDDSGNILYSRITGMNHYGSDLVLPGWPAWNGRKIIGLDPDSYYALSPGIPDSFYAQISSLPDGIKLKRFVETDTFSLISLDKTTGDSPSKGHMTLQLKKNFPLAVVNGKYYSNFSGVKDLETDFPCSIVLFGRSPWTPEAPAYLDSFRNSRYFYPEQGISFGACIPRELSSEIPGEKREIPFLCYGYAYWCHEVFMLGNIFLDFPLKVESANSAVKFYLQNHSLFGQNFIARAYINGILVHEYDFQVKSSSDKNLHLWQIALGKYAGKNILLTIELDRKKKAYCPIAWISSPKLIHSSDQNNSYMAFADGKYIPEEQSRKMLSSRPATKKSGKKDYVRNGGFEIVSPDGGIRNWNPVYNGFACSSRINHTSPGNRSAKLANGNEKRAFVSGMSQWITGYPKGAKLKIRVHFYIDEWSRGVFYPVLIHINKNGKVHSICEKVTIDRKKDYQKKWIQHTYVLDTSHYPEAKGFVLHILTGGKNFEGDIYIDDVSVIEEDGH
ncbi:MAG: hypothetical protein J5858_12035 [Lentisphaeria bacterium]|nr:hypothetical protein [Lentisphaeria bacterium]